MDCDEQIATQINNSVQRVTADIERKGISIRTDVIQLVSRAEVMTALSKMKDAMFLSSLALMLYEKTSTATGNDKALDFLREKNNIMKENWFGTLKKESEADSSDFLTPYETNVDVESERFDKVIGLKKEKLDIQNKFIMSTLFPLVYAMSMREVKPKHILLYGPPGTGKTITGRMTAAELKHQSRGDMTFRFFSITASELRDRYEGGTEKNIKSAFVDGAVKAGKNGRSILFFDEFESLAESRTEGDSGRSVTTLLQQMDGAGSQQNVVVLAATNYPWKLDAAILRRFSGKILVDLPNFDNIVSLIFSKFVKLIKFHNIKTFKTEGIPGTDDSNFKAVIEKFNKYKDLLVTYDERYFKYKGKTNFRINYNSESKKFVKKTNANGEKSYSKVKFDEFKKSIMKSFVDRSVGDNEILSAFKEKYMKQILESEGLKNNGTSRNLYSTVFDFSMFLAEFMSPHPLWYFYDKADIRFIRKVRTPFLDDVEMKVSGQNINGYSNSDINRVFETFMEIRGISIINEQQNKNKQPGQPTVAKFATKDPEVFQAISNSDRGEQIKTIYAYHIYTAFNQYSSNISQDSEYIDMLCYQRYLNKPECKQAFHEWQKEFLSQSTDKAVANEQPGGPSTPLRGEGGGRGGGGS